MILPALLTVCQLAFAGTAASDWESQSRIFDHHTPAAKPAPGAVDGSGAAPLRAWPAGAKGSSGPQVLVPRGMRKGGSLLSTLAVEFPGYRHMHGADERREGFLLRLGRAAISPLVGPLCGTPHAALWGGYLFWDGGDGLGAAAAAGLGFLVGLIGGIAVGVAETFRNLWLGVRDLARGRLFPSGGASPG